MADPIKRLSKGISPDVDLTARGDFRNGARPMLLDPEMRTGELPWDKTGKPKPPISRYPEYSVDAPWVWNGSDQSWMLFNTLTLDDFIIDGYDVDFDCYVYGIEMGEDYPGNRVNRIIEQFKMTGDARLLVLLPGKLELSRGRLRYSNTDSLSVSGSMIYYPRSSDMSIYYSTTPSAMSASYGWSSNTTGSLNSTTTQSTSSMLSIAVDNRMDITPTEFGAVTLTRDELNGDVIVGRADEVADKIRLRRYVQQIKPYIDYRNRDRNALPKPSIPKTAVDHQTKSADILRTFRMKEYAPKCVAYDKRRVEALQFMYEADEQSDWYQDREDKTIDYFFQPVYSDRGRHLLHRPRNSHELQVDLSGQELSEDSFPVRQPRKLVYDKRHAGLLDPKTEIVNVPRRFNFDDLTT